MTERRNFFQLPGWPLSLGAAFAASFAIAIAIAVAAILYLSWLRAPGGKLPEAAAATCAVMVSFACFLIHALFLNLMPGLSTHTARLLGLLFPGLPILAGAAFHLATGDTSQAAALALAAYATPVALLVFAPTFMIYSMPCTVLSSLPLLAHYLVLGLSPWIGPAGLMPYLILLMAAYWFPTYRRLVEYWRPARLPLLPRPPRRNAGVTLIELLIQIAIVSILTGAIVHATSAVHRSLEQQEDWRRAIALCEDELALLRARPALPAIGRHPVEPELSDLYPFADRAEVEIRPGPSAALREARVTVRLRDEATRRDVMLATLLAAQGTAR